MEVVNTFFLRIHGKISKEMLLYMMGYIQTAFNIQRYTKNTIASLFKQSIMEGKAQKILYLATFLKKKITKTNYSTNKK